MKECTCNCKDGKCTCGAAEENLSVIRECVLDALREVGVRGVLNVFLRAPSGRLFPAQVDGRQINTTPDEKSKNEALAKVNAAYHKNYTLDQLIFQPAA